MVTSVPARRATRRAPASRHDVGRALRLTEKLVRRAYIAAKNAPIPTHPPTVWRRR